MRKMTQTFQDQERIKMAREALEVHARDGRDDELTAQLRVIAGVPADGVTPVPVYATRSDDFVPPPASPKQRSYIQSLLVERQHGWPTDDLEELEQLKFGRELGKREASQAIDYLLSRPVANGAPAQDLRDSWPEVEDGRYAVRNDAGAENDLAFYVVSHSRTGRVYVKHQTGPNMTPVPFQQIGAILTKIAAEPKVAMLRYGVELGTCGACGLELTNQTSREYGVGPVCRGKRGW